MNVGLMERPIATGGFSPVPVSRIIRIGLRAYRRHWRSYTLCFLAFAAPVILADLVLGEMVNVPGAVNNIGAAIPKNLTRFFQGSANYAQWADFVTGYFLASIAATVVLTALSEAYHDRPIRTARCVRASWRTLPSIVAVSVAQMVAIIVAAFTAGFTLGFLGAVIGRSQNAAVILLLFGAMLLVLAVLWLAVVMICVLVAIAVAQIVLQRRSARTSVGRALRTVCSRRHFRTVAKQGVVLSLFSSMVLAAAMVVVFVPLGIVSAFVPPSFVGLETNIATIILPSLFWPPITIVYALYSIQLLEASTPGSTPVLATALTPS